MGDQHKSMGIVGEILFQPVAGFEVKMVGGFVQQEQVWLCNRSLARAIRICQPPENSSVWQVPVLFGKT